MNSVQELLARPFSSRTRENKIQIKSLGRPTPNVSLSEPAKSKKYVYTRQFNRKTYTEVSWICGCEVRNALFCFPCLLFGGEPAWSKSGVTKLNHLKDYIKRHCHNKTHIVNVLKLANVGTVNIATQLDSAYRLSIKKHNEEVEKNRYILSKIIDCIRFCGAFELALRGHDESDGPNNPGIFRGLVDLMGSIDIATKDYIESNAVFKNTSKAIQNELLDCMLEICQEEIKKEINTAKFVAVIADDITDISEKVQIALVFRYEHLGKIYERFWSFLNPEDQHVRAVSRCILKEVRPLIQNDEKVIAQSYDGAAFMCGKSDSVQANVQEVFPNARFTHCYAHQLNLVMTQCASQNKAARVFFSTLSAIPAFFSQSPLRLAAFEKAMADRSLQASNTIWTSKCGVVNAVYEHREPLIDCLEILENTRSTETIQQARGLRLHLEDPEFNFWLSFFHQIMPHVDVLLQQLRSPKVDSDFIKMGVDGFIKTVENVRSEVDNILRDVDESIETTYFFTNTKRRRQEDSRSANAREICDLIITQAKNRFEFVEYSDISKLIDSAYFSANSLKFPESELDTAVKTYPSLNKKKLKAELSVLYETPDFRNVDGASTLLNFVIKNNIEDTFEEMSKLIRILITIPFKIADAERCFSTLKRIKTFLRNTVSQERLNALAMLSIEKEMIKNMKNFNTKVIEKFVNRETGRMEFIFRH